MELYLYVDQKSGKIRPLSKQKDLRYSAIAPDTENKIKLIV